MAATRHARRKTTERKSEGNVRQAGVPAASSRVLDRLRRRLSRELNGRKDRATMALDDVAETVRRVGEPLHRSSYATAGGEYTEAAAARLHEWASALRERDVNELAADLGDLARRRPALFVGAGFAAGMLAARIAKAGRE
ncbi:MAG: hypothetical protein ACM3NQ_24045 [Bacteroidales bacterium]